MNNIFELTPCISGTTIWQQPALQPYLLQLKQLISAPPDIYQELYMTTLLRFAEFCQAMPFDLEKPVPYSLLQRQLELALVALKLRRGRMLPQHSESEIIAEQEPVWTYATFTSCLFTGLSRIQQDRHVELFVNSHEKIGDWSVLTGNLFEPKTYYKLGAATSKLALMEPAICNALLIGRIVPTVALRWLASQPAILASWWQSITHNGSITKKDGLITLLEDAAQKINYPLYYGEQPETSQPDTGSTTIKKIADKSDSQQTLEDLTQWLEQQYETSGCDAEQDLLLRIPTGLFIEVKRMADFLNRYPTYASQRHLLQRLDEYLLKENNSVIHHYRPSRFEKRLILEGIILREMFLPPSMKSQPMQSSFVPEIPL